MTSPPRSAVPFVVHYTPGAGRLSVVEGDGPRREYLLPDLSQQACGGLVKRLIDDFGLAAEGLTPPAVAPRAAPGLRPVLTEAVDPRILYGYGDPCVVKVAEDEYRLLVTSNDAPDIFPILASRDLESWRLSSFVFPRGAAPDWAMTGAEVSDFWAPELHRVGKAWWVCFTARMRDGTLAIGIARSPSPDGPFAPDAEPVVSGGVIDPHIVLDEHQRPWLVWKQDDNDRWPRELAALLHARPDLAPTLFHGAHVRTASLFAGLWPFVRKLEPMAQFCSLQPLIDVVAGDLDLFARRLELARAGLMPEAQAQADVVLSTLRTRIWTQELSADGRALVGEPVVVLQNDRPWEGHLIEGVWITREAGRYHLLYAGNDFATSRYAIGAAVADTVTGPYRKQDEVFLGSTSEWWGPGHPSVVHTPEGRARIFLHGFRPGVTGYKAFRALLTAPLTFDAEQLILG